MPRCLRVAALLSMALALGGCSALASIGKGDVGAGGGASVDAGDGGDTDGASGDDTVIDAEGRAGRVGIDLDAGVDAVGVAGANVGSGIDSGVGAGAELDPDAAPRAGAALGLWQDEDASAARSTTLHALPPRGGTSNDLLVKPVATGRLTSGFGPRRGRRHNGIDYAAPRGTAVYAVEDGVVEVLRRSDSYGRYIRIRHADGLASVYAHLSGFAAGLSQGGKVRRGQTIGAVGASGRATGPHLHYELISGDTFVDPLGDP